MPAANFVIKGGITRASDGKGIPDLRVEAWGITKSSTAGVNVFAEVKTGERGEFRINISPETAEALRKNKSRVNFLVFRNKSLLVDSAQHNIFWDITQPAQIAICLDIPVNITGSARDQVSIVRGNVADQDGNGVPGLFVVAYDQSIGIHGGIAGTRKEGFTLGTSITNDDGCYHIQYDEGDLASPGKGAADLVVKVYESPKMGEILATSPVLLQALEEEVINLSISKDGFRSRTEFDAVSAKLHPLLRQSVPDRLDDADIALLATRVGLQETQVRLFILAFKQFQETQIPAEWLYGLYRVGQPTSLMTLAVTAPAILEKAFDLAQSRNIIRHQEKDAFSKLVEMLHGISLKTLNDTSTPALADIRKITDMAKLTAKDRQVFMGAYSNHNEPLNVFWDKLAEDGNISADRQQRLRFGFEVYTISMNHMPLVEAINGDGNLNSLRDLAGMDAVSWQRYLQAKSIAAPANIPGKNAKEQQANYAVLLSRLSEDAAPTAALSASWTRDEAMDKDVAKFFSNNPEYGFEKQGINDYLKQNPDALKGVGDKELATENLRGVQNLFRIAPRFERFNTVKTLWQENIRSSHAIKKMGQDKFVAAYADKVGGAAQAQMLYMNAAKATNMSLMAMMKFAWDANTINPYVVPQLDLSASLPNGRATLAELFGNLDFCACKHCRSVYSPAAYLADLLMFLNNSTAKNGDTGLEKFFARRPDVGNILLNCENTNTPMPYIDLVNEVLEDAILPRTYTSHTYQGTTVKVANVPQTTETRAQILRAYPEYLNKDVYNLHVNTASYPWNLPFNLWAEEARVYLKQMGVARHDLMKTFSGTVSSPTALDIAVESLGLLPLEKDLVTTSVNSAAQLKNLWGVKSGTVPAALTKVSAFLDRANISYDQLVQLLQCKFVRTGAMTGNVEIHFDPEHPCSLDDATLENLTLDKLDMMHRFLRLAKRLNWHFFALDRALTAFGKTTIDTGFLVLLAGVNALKNSLNVELETALSWFSSRIGTIPYKDSPALYTETFLNSAVGDQKEEVRATLTLNGAKTEISNTTKLLTAVDYAPVVLAASGITSDDLALIIKADLADNAALNLASLSHIYRVGTFCRALRLSVRDYYTLKTISGLSPLTTPLAFATPESAEQFILARKGVTISGFKLPQLAYILQHDITQPGSGQLQETAIAQRLTAIRQDLLAIRTENQMPAENLEAVLTQKLAGVLVGEDKVNIALHIINGSSPLSNNDQKQFIQDHFSAFLNVADAKDKLVPPVNSLGGDINARQSYVLEPLLAYLLPRLSRQYLTQKTSENLDISATAAEALLQTVKNPADNTQTAYTALMAESFVESVGEITAAAFTNLFSLYERLAKGGLLLSTLAKQVDIEDKDMPYVVTQGPTLGWIDFNTLPLALVANKTELENRFTQFLLLVQSYDAAKRIFLTDKTLGDFLIAAGLGTLANTKQLLADNSSWALTDIDKFVTNYGYLAADVKKPGWLVRLDKAFALLRKVGVTAAQGWGWNSADVTFDQAAQIRFACKSNYDNAKWLEIAPSLRDPIREKQRDALLAYVIHNKGFVDADAVYEYYLIDVQMSAIGDSSRIVLAISAVQLFVQRILMNLEAGEIEFSHAETKQWKWRKNYRVWEAARKVFLYAENWIWPELRDDKSYFYTEMESELSQMDLNDKNVEKAYLHYLKKLDRVSNLEVAGMYEEKERNILHVFARTSTHPHRYYYRKWVNKSSWTAWEFVDLDIEGDHLIPAIHNRRLFLFWPKFNSKSVEPSGDSMSASGNSVTPTEPERYLEIRMAWSQYDEGNWSPVQVSKQFIETTKKTYPIARKDLYFFTDYLDDGTLLIRPRVIPAVYLNELSTQAAFYYNDITDKVGRYFPPRGDMDPFFGYPLYVLAMMNTDAVLNKLPGGDNDFMQIVKSTQPRKLEVYTHATTNGEGTINASSKKTEVLLNNAAEGFQVMVPQQYPTFDSQTPFFYADNKRNFFVVPEDIYAPIYMPWDYGFKATDHIQVDKPKKIPELVYEVEEYFVDPFEIYGNPVDQIYTDFTHGYYTGNSAAGRVLDRRAISEQQVKSYQISTDYGKVGFPANNGFNYTNRVGFNTAAKGTMFMRPRVIPTAEHKEIFANMENANLPRTMRFAQPALRLNHALRTTTSATPAVRSRTAAARTTTAARSEIVTIDAARASTPSAGYRIDNGQMFELAATAYQAEYFYGALQIIIGWQWIGKRFRFYNFYHTFAPLMIKQLNRYGVEGLLAPTPDHGADWTKLQRQKVSTSYFKTTYDPTSHVDVKYPKEEFDFSYGGAYSQYNWELFFHVPLTIAERLMQDQKFDEAQRWFHYIFNPTETEGPAPKRFWKIKPFYEFDDETSMAKLLELLNKGDKDMEAQVEEWENDPFNPHLIARMRPLVYMKAVVMKYLDNLIAWGDFLFRQDTTESINEAVQLYVLAGQILGRKPVMVEKSDVTAKTFNQLFPDMDSLSNALVTVESSLSPSSTLSAGGTSSGESGVLDTILYFCLPVNDKLLGYWDKVGDRLFKIRNGMNIDGVRRSLSLFAPPIDPGMLVKARAAGLDLASVLADIGGALPAYRFNYMLNRTLEFVGDVKALGSALLAALERRDAEDMSLLQAAHQIQLLTATKTLRKRAIDEAKFNKQALEQQRELSVIRQQHFNSLEFMNAAEIIGVTLQALALIPQIVGTVSELMASAASLAPDFSIGASGFGGSPHVTVQWGSSNLERAAGHFTSFLFQTAATLNNGATIANAIANYQRRSEDWDLQKKLAGQELKQIDKQLLAADIRIEMAEIEVDLQDLQVSHAKSEETFLRNKFTNRDLYHWMVGELSTLYFQSYQLAYDMAKRTEKCFRHELAIPDSNYIQFGYWDSLKKGLLAGERLLKDLRRLESAYLEQNRRDLELLKHVSLAQLNPFALLQLQQTGTCEFSVPEAWFDMDHPGHYFRRLKTVSVTIPCVTGPYTTISAKLSLLSNRARTSTEVSGGYAYTGLDDTRFVHNLVGIQSIATSTAQRDSGLFELSFQDERYLPFEGAGAISTWQLTLPEEYRQFDYTTISDVILHLSFTARDAGEPLRGTVEADLTDSFNKLADILSASDTGLTRIVSVAQQFGSNWHNFLYPPAASTKQELNVRLDRSLFAYMLRKRGLDISKIEYYLILDDAAVYADGSTLAASVKKPDTTSVNANFTADPTAGSQPFLSVPVSITLEDASPSATLTLTVQESAVGGLAEDLVEERDGKDRLNPASVKDIILRITYTIA